MLTMLTHGKFFYFGKNKKLMIKLKSKKNFFLDFRKLCVHVVVDYADTLSALSLTMLTCAEIVVDYADTKMTTHTLSEKF